MQVEKNQPCKRKERDSQRFSSSCDTKKSALHYLNVAMSTEPILTLLKLPVELFYCILDRLDTKDILFSFRNVCTHFHTITSTYNRYKIQITSTSSKADIHRMCQIIRPENITSLVLTNTNARETSDQILLFLSLIGVHQLTRLSSLDLFGLSM